MEFYILLGVFTVIIVAFQLMKNIFVNLVGVRNDNVFCCRKYMAKNVEFDQEGYFKCIKIGLFKFVFYQGLLCTCFQASISIIIELIYTIFSPFLDHVLIFKNWLQLLLFSLKKLNTILLLRVNFSKSDNHV